MIVPIRNEWLDFCPPRSAWFLQSTARVGVVTQIRTNKRPLQEAGRKSIDFTPKYVVVLHVMMQRIDRLGLLKTCCCPKYQ